MRDDENRLVAEPKKDRGQRRLQIASIGKVLDKILFSWWPSLRRVLLWGNFREYHKGTWKSMSSFRDRRVHSGFRRQFHCSQSRCSTHAYWSHVFWCQSDRFETGWRKLLNSLMFSVDFHDSNVKSGKPSKLYTFGKSRAEVLGAMFSIISLWIITGSLEMPLSKTM